MLGVKIANGTIQGGEGAMNALVLKEYSQGVT